jgi:DNA-binding response OmpR family regulator
VGFDDYLTKPIKLNKIQPVVEAGFEEIKKRMKSRR